MWGKTIQLVEGQTATSTTTATVTVQESKPQSAGFAANDSTGVGMTIIAMVVVLGALLLLFLVFKNIGRLMDSYLSRSKSVPEKGKKSDSAGVVAAIMLALHESNSLHHDEEIVEITIQEFSRRYSPWNSKSYAVLHNRLRR